MEGSRSTATALLIALALLAESSERSGEVFTPPLGYQLGSATLEMEHDGYRLYRINGS